MSTYLPVQVLLKDIAMRTAVNMDNLSHQLRPDLLLRQHSLPASLHTQGQRGRASGGTEGKNTCFTH